MPDRYASCTYRSESGDPKKDLLKTSIEGLALIGHQFSQVTHSWVIWAYMHQVGWFNYYKRVTF
jgi:hypothetical protein